MKVEINKEIDLFGQIVVTIKKRGLYFSGLFQDDQEANKYIYDKLQRIASDTVIKMYDQKAFFFSFGKYSSSMALAWQALRDAVKNPLTLEYIKSDVLEILQDLIPSKTSQHYELFKQRYDWLFSLCFDADNNLNARQLRNLYILKDNEKNILTA